LICYMTLPESRGGSKTRGEDYMNKTVARGGGWLLPRWARGKYGLPIKGNGMAAADDLAWVARKTRRRIGIIIRGAFISRTMRAD